MALLDGQVAIVSGAAQGLGAAYARALAENGASVVAFDVQGSIVEVAASIAADTGQRVDGVVADVSLKEDCQRIVLDTVANFGGPATATRWSATTPPQRPNSSGP